MVPSPYGTSVDLSLERRPLLQSEEQFVRTCLSAPGCGRDSSSWWSGCRKCEPIPNIQQHSLALCVMYPRAYITAQFVTYIRLGGIIFFFGFFLIW